MTKLILLDSLLQEIIMQFHTVVCGLYNYELISQIKLEEEMSVVLKKSSYKGQASVEVYHAGLLSGHIAQEDVMEVLSFINNGQIVWTNRGGERRCLCV